MFGWALQCEEWTHIEAANSMLWRASNRTNLDTHKPPTQLSLATAVQVDVTPPHIEEDGQVYNAPGCKVALTQSQTDMLWYSPQPL